MVAATHLCAGPIDEFIIAMPSSIFLTQKAKRVSAAT